MLGDVVDLIGIGDVQVGGDKGVAYQTRTFDGEDFLAVDLGKLKPVRTGGQGKAILLGLVGYHIRGACRNVSGIGTQHHQRSLAADANLLNRLEGGSPDSHVGNTTVQRSIESKAEHTVFGALKATGKSVDEHPIPYQIADHQT